jgi:hypothetical protein
MSMMQMAVSGYLDPAISLLKKTDGAHLYRPGVGWLDNLRAGNYTDSAGTLPGVLDSPVGLTVDALGGLGNTVVVNGSFTTDANWTKGSGWTISNGQAVLTAGGGVLEQVMGSVNVGASYIASISTNLLLQLRIGGVNIGYFAPKNGTILCFIKAITGTLIELVPNGTQTGYVSKISVREISGIHASQNTTEKKPKLTRRVNLLTKTEDFGDAAWSKHASGTGSLPIVTSNYSLAPNGTLTASRVQFALNGGVNTSDISSIFNSIQSTTEFSYKGSIWVKTNDATTKNIQWRDDSGGAVVDQILTVNELWQEFTFTGTESINNYINFRFWLRGSLGTSDSADISIWGASLTNAADARYPYQRVNTTTDYNTLGFPDRWDFDTTDRLQLTLPAGYESATIIDATSAGPVTLLEQDVTGAYGIVGGLTNNENVLPALNTSSWGANDAGWTKSGTNAVATSVTGGKSFYATEFVKNYKTYEYLVVIDSVSEGGIYVSLGAAGSPILNTTGKHQGIIATTNVNANSNLITDGVSTTVTVSKFAIREILPSTHGRIILRDTPNYRSLSSYQSLMAGLAGLPFIPWTPAALFSKSEQGAWYDPSDMSTLFQDSAGTMPVTAVEQPVGLMLDLSGRGNHAQQVTSTKRPVLSARVNLLTKTEDFSDAVWAKESGTTITPNTTIAPDGTLTADTVSQTGGRIFQAAFFSAFAGLRATAEFYIKANIATTVIADFNGLNNTANNSLGTTSFSITTDWQRFTHSKTIGGNDVGLFVLIRGTSGQDFQIWGAQLDLGVSTPTKYQRVNTNLDYATDGFKKYLKFDGVDDALVTESIDFTATDKMTVWAGVRKLSDAALMVVADTGSNNLGGFSVFTGNPVTGGAPAWATSFQSSAGGGAINVTSPLNFEAPDTAVITSILDTVNAGSYVRVDGVLQTTSPINPLDGTFGNIPLGLGRAGVNNLNGNIYSLIIRGAQSTVTEVITSEMWVNNKTGAY